MRMTLAIAFAAALLGLCGIPAGALQISNLAPTGTLTTSTWMRGDLTATNGTTNTLTLQLAYGTTDGSTNFTSWTHTNRFLTVASTGAVSTNITGLSAASLYYYRWYAIEGTGTAWAAASTSFWTAAAYPTGAAPSAANWPVLVDSNGVVLTPIGFAPSNNLVTNIAGAGAASASGSNSDWTITVPDLDPRVGDLETRMGYAEGNIDNIGGLLAYNDLLDSPTPMVDGFWDFFDDQSGVNTGTGSNYTYSSSGWYSWARYGESFGTAVGAVLHLDGSDGATNFADSSDSGKAITVYGDAQVDTAIKMLGTGSLILDGNGDYLTMANSTDWDFGTGNFTVEYFIYRGSTNFVFNMGVVSTMAWPNGWGFNMGNGTGTTNFFNRPAIVTSAFGPLCSSNECAANAWSHVAIVRSNNVIYIYLNGTNTASLSCSGQTFNSSGLGLIVGSLSISSPASFLHGQVDEVRVSKGVAQYAGTFTPPAAPFSPSPAGGNMLLQGTNHAAHVLGFAPIVGRISVEVDDLGTAIPTNKISPYISRDNGTNWTAAPLVNKTREVNTSSNLWVYYSDTNAFSGTGSNLNWKILTTDTNTAGRVSGVMMHAR